MVSWVSQPLWLLDIRAGGKFSSRFENIDLGDVVAGLAKVAIPNT